MIPFVCNLEPVDGKIYDDFRNRIAFMKTIDGDVNMNLLCLLRLYFEKY